MKMRERIRAIADTDEYREFAELWQRFDHDGWRDPNAHVSRMVLLGQKLQNAAIKARAAHVEALPHGPVHAIAVPRFLMEINRSFSGSLEKEAPELLAYRNWLEALLRERKRAGVRT